MVLRLDVIFMFMEVGCLQIKLLRKVVKNILLVAQSSFAGDKILLPGFQGMPNDGPLFEDEIIGQGCAPWPDIRFQPRLLFGSRRF